MSAKVGLLSESQKLTDDPAERVRRNVAEYLVRRLLAVAIGKYLYQRIRVRPTAEIHIHPAIGYAQPSKSVRGGKLKWQPPNQPLKAHPFIPMQTDEMEAISLSRKERSEQFSL